MARDLAIGRCSMVQVSHLHHHRDNSSSLKKELAAVVLKPFGYNVDLNLRPRDNRLPGATVCEEDQLVHILTSSGSAWLAVRAAFTENTFFLSKTHDHSTAAHVVPLHEVVKISKYASQVSLASKQDDGLPSRRSHQAAVPPDSEHILSIETIQNGYNFGRVFLLQVGSEETLDRWLHALERFRVEETQAFNRRTYISRKQSALSSFYESKLVQYIVAFLIMSNFAIEAFSLQVRFDPDSQQAQHLRNIDVCFTLAFFVELIINMSANLVWKFLKNPWYSFELVCS